VILRSMLQACYSPNPAVGHFGLAITDYAHFTSPIRRYPDLLVHRGIRHLIRSRSDAKGVSRIRGAALIPTAQIFPYDIHAMVVHGEHCSMAERRADDATREVHAWLKCEYLQQHVGEEFAGVITAVTSFGLFVELKDLYIEGLVHITALPGDYYNFDQAHQRLTGERSGRSFQLGGSVRVQVARVDLDDRKIDLELVEAKPARKAKSKKTADSPADGDRKKGPKGGKKSATSRKPKGKADTRRRH
jgi:ribonuclease R